MHPHKKMLLSVLALVLLIVLALGYLFIVRGKPAVQPNQSPSAPKAAEPTPTPNNDVAAPTNAPGVYKAYTAEAVASTSGVKVLFFHAPWCPQCRELEASIKAGPIPDNVTIFKVDYDSNQALRQKYGVTLQTTLVKIDDAGNMIKKYVAYNEPSLDAVKRNLLQ